MEVWLLAFSLQPLSLAHLLVFFFIFSCFFFFFTQHSKESLKTSSVFLQHVPYSNNLIWGHSVGLLRWNYLHFPFSWLRLQESGAPDRTNNTFMYFAFDHILKEKMTEQYQSLERREQAAGSYTLTATVYISVSLSSFSFLVLCFICFNQGWNIHKIQRSQLTHKSDRVWILCPVLFTWTNKSCLWPHHYNTGTWGLTSFGVEFKPPVEGGQSRFMRPGLGCLVMFTEQTERCIFKIRFYFNKSISRERKSNKNAGRFHRHWNIVLA